MGVKFKLDGDAFLLGSLSVLPLLHGAHDGLPEDPAATQQFGGFDFSARIDRHLNADDATDVQPLQSLGIFGLYPRDDFSVGGIRLPGLCACPGGVDGSGKREERQRHEGCSKLFPSECCAVPDRGREGSVLGSATVNW